MSRRLRAAVDATIEVHCGYCGEPWELSIDPSAGESQSYIEDCPVCCRPNEVRVSIDDETLEARGDVSYES
ncbi:MAG: CPXCG motif-containing cysteine-rich protein [Deltaproteobacteria bacterium]|nr:CPXCG motif-containing cysteine-rich protein [Deltaproteobacteria bacterium]